MVGYNPSSVIAMDFLAAVNANFHFLFVSQLDGEFPCVSTYADALKNCCRTSMPDLISSETSRDVGQPQKAGW